MLTDHSSIPNVLSYTTLRLKCAMPNNEWSIGTGFHLKFEDNNESIIVTNKHVVEGATSARVHFTRSTDVKTPDVGNHFEALLPDFDRMWVSHPDPSVDLAAILVSRLKGILVPKAGHNNSNDVFLPYLGTSLIPNETRFEEMQLIEDIIMVGYPIGLWDSVNNLPIVRRGITATHPAADFNGRREFLIDCACFPGSSGSPVFRYRPEFPMKSGAGIQISGGKARIELLGILSSGPQHSAEGQIRIVQLPTASTAVPRIEIPINIGVVIRSDRLREFGGMTS